MRELCEAQSALLSYTGPQAIIDDDLSCITENNIERSEALTGIIEYDPPQEDVSTECGPSVSLIYIN